jgi:hypothetical protein
MSLTPRAQRFPIAARVLWRQYSRRDLGHWFEAQSINMSRSGLLFTGGDLPANGARVELIFALSFDSLVDCADVRCSGHIVRSEARQSGAQAVASTIEDYTFLKAR